MKISFFPPNDFQADFTKLLPHHTFLRGCCDKGCDLIYCGSPSQLHLALKAKQQFDKPLICWCWDMPFNWREWCETIEAHKANMHRDSVIMRQVNMLKQCDRIISGSKYTQKILKSRYNLDSEQLYFHIETKILDKTPIQNNKGYVLQVSRYAYNKKFEHSIRACAKIKKPLVAAGTGAVYMKKLIKEADGLNVDSTFHHNITRDYLSRVIKGAEIVVSPSLNEGFGLTPIEAIYCGKPVLLSDIEVFKEIYEDNALYHEKNNVEDFANKLELLYNDKALQKRIVEKCRPCIADFTIEKFAKRWDKIITQ